MIAVSNATAKRVLRGLPIGKRVHNDPQRRGSGQVSARRAGRIEFRKTIGVSEEDFLVCAVGQICARKGLLELIDALRRIIEQAPHMHLAIVGKVVFRHEEEYLDALRAAVKVSGIERSRSFHRRASRRIRRTAGGGSSRAEFAR